jgi:hypothetical protein
MLDLFGTAKSGKKNAIRAGQEEKSGIRQGEDALRAFGKEAYGYLDQGIAAQQPMLERGQKGIDWYSQMLMGGGNPGDRQAFLEQTPGYQWTLDQGLEGINRGRNAAGMLESGNADIDRMNYASGLASKTYLDLLNAGQPYFGLGQNAASNIQQGYTNKGNVAQNTGRGIADLSVKKGLAGAGMWNNINSAQQAGNQESWGAILGLGNMLTGGLKGFI